ncbi:MAG: GntR family transcriptional regulator [Candidatus Omnitrophica bacterium]|nr:GntR family transcriptional regulator [Candidatus Omnitrophota bacterium]
MEKFETITKFQRIADFLEQEIKKGNYPTDTKLPSERYIAKKYNISHMTVNKAIATLEARKVVQRSHGNGTYVLKPKIKISTKTIGAIIDTEKMLHAPFSHMLPSFFQNKGYLTTIFDISQQLTLKENLSLFFQDAPKSLIIDGYSILPFFIIDNLPVETKLIFINRFEGPKKYKASYVLYDYKMAGYMAAKQLIKTGKKRIMILSFQIQSGWTSDLFFQGCKKAFEEDTTTMFIYIDYFKNPISEQIEIFKKEKPDGIISFGDSLAIPIIKAIKEMGLKIPQDVAIIGFHNSPWASAYNMTSISLQEEVMIEKTYECIESKEEKEIIIGPKIVFRNSCTKE